MASPSMPAAPQLLMPTETKVSYETRTRQVNQMQEVHQYSYQKTQGASMMEWQQMSQMPMSPQQQQQVQVQQGPPQSPMSVSQYVMSPQQPRQQQMPAASPNSQLMPSDRQPAPQQMVQMQQPQVVQVQPVPYQQQQPQQVQLMMPSSTRRQGTHVERYGSEYVGVIPTGKTPPPMAAPMAMMPTGRTPPPMAAPVAMMPTGRTPPAMAAPVAMMPTGRTPPAMAAPMQMMPSGKTPPPMAVPAGAHVERQGGEFVGVIPKTRHSSEYMVAMMSTGQTPPPMPMPSGKTPPPMMELIPVQPVQPQSSEPMPVTYQSQNGMSSPQKMVSVYQMEQSMYGSYQPPRQQQQPLQPQQQQQQQPIPPQRMPSPQRPPQQFQQMQRMQQVQQPQRQMAPQDMQQQQQYMEPPRQFPANNPPHAAPPQDNRQQNMQRELIERRNMYPPPPVQDYNTTPGPPNMNQNISPVTRQPVQQEANLMQKAFPLESKAPLQNINLNDSYVQQFMKPVPEPAMPQQMYRPGSPHNQPVDSAQFQDALLQSYSSLPDHYNSGGSLSRKKNFETPQDAWAQTGDSLQPQRVYTEYKIVERPAEVVPPPPQMSTHSVQTGDSLQPQMIIAPPAPPAPVTQAMTIQTQTEDEVLPPVPVFEAPPPVAAAAPPRPPIETYTPPAPVEDADAYAPLPPSQQFRPSAIAELEAPRVRPAARPMSEPVKPVAAPDPHQHRVGFGLLLERDDGSRTTFVAQVVPGFGAADSEQVEVNDILTSIDGQDCTTRSLDEVKLLSIGQEGTFSTLDMIRPPFHRYQVVLKRIIPNKFDENNLECSAKIMQEM